MPKPRNASSLSLEELYRRRAVDRHNQRALRSRYKDRITQLEDRLRDVTTQLGQSGPSKQALAPQQLDYQTPGHSVPHVARATSAINPPATVSAIPSLPSPASSSGPDHQFVLSSSSMLSLSPSRYELPPSTVFEVDGADKLYLHGPSPKFWATTPNFATLQDNTGVHGSEQQRHTHEQPELSAIREYLQTQTHSRQNTYTSNYDDFSLDFASISAELGTSSSVATNIVQSEIPNESTWPIAHHVTYGRREGQIEANKARERHPFWEVTPTFTQPTCLTDTLVIDLIHQRRQRDANVEEESEFSKVSFPSIDSLLNPVSDEPNSVVSSTIARHVASVVRVKTIPEKVALLYIICVLVRWYIRPTEYNYDALPEFIRPVAAQLTTPHPVWVSTLAWPKARERIIRYMDYTRWEELAQAITGTFSINWPYGIASIFLQSGPGSERVLSPSFINHIQDLSNWTIGQRLVDTFPFLQGAVNVKK